MKFNILSRTQSNRYEIFFSFILACLFSVGLVSHVFGLRDLMVSITEEFVFLCNTIVTFGLFWRSFAINKKVKWSLVWWFIGIFAATLWVEIEGVETGLIFGEYQYGDVFQLQIFGVPWIIGWNWVLVVVGSLLFVQNLYQFIFKRFVADWFLSQDKPENLAPWVKLGFNLLIAFTTGLVAAGFDFILERSAVEYGYWIWEGGIIPTQNYIAWFVIAFLIALSLLRFEVPFYSKLARDYLYYQTIFFLGLFINIVL